MFEQRPHLQVDPLWTPRKDDEGRPRKRHATAGPGGGPARSAPTGGAKAGRARSAPGPRQQVRGWTGFTTYGLAMRDVVRAENPGASASEVEKARPADQL